ncbi:hypothetical protein KCP69_08690 [Salmonella enterica subsp. enterica]|nr:hypothetical protein KCP69_08690 [Salmonella enterica subsp. enterica]
MPACDASALPRHESRQFIPLAIDGPRRTLSADVLPSKGIRARSHARAGEWKCFPADSDLPDPYDGLNSGQESLKVHARVGSPLFAGQNPPHRCADP